MLESHISLKICSQLNIYDSKYNDNLVRAVFTAWLYKLLNKILIFVLLSICVKR